MQELVNTDFPSFRAVPNTGVIYVMEKAAAAGFTYGNPDWVNLGQGAPEAGELPDAPPRLQQIVLDDAKSEYAPVAGLRELRQAVADLYNQRFRKGKASQYTYRNVAISSGGRAGLTRIAAALGNINLGHFLPDYTAYEELLDLFRTFVPIPIVSDSLALPSARKLDFEIMSRGLGGLLLSNPCNPTGYSVYGEELAEWVAVCRKRQCALILDEFYSHYFYQKTFSGAPALSACPFIEDVNKDPVIIVDGLTKNWRYPGLRLSWTLGPEQIISSVSSAGSFLDGGAPHPIQSGVLDLLTLEHADREATALQATFVKKRNLLMGKLLEWGIPPDPLPQGGFYCFPNLADLPGGLRDGLDFFHAALELKVICVPGVFFDVNPGHRRRHEDSRLRNYVRLSYGPSIEELAEGLKRLDKLLG